MKCASVFLIAGIAARLGAQSFVLDVPDKSQAAEVSQRIGLTAVTIRYHRPLVAGRKIWGDLVPYGKVWRTGANVNTTIEFTDPVTVEGRALAAGTYGLHTIPTANEWTIIFSKNATSWGSFTYNAAEDALRVSVKPQPSDFHEALTFEFAEVRPDSAVVSLQWEKVAVPFRIGVDVHAIAQDSFKKQLRTLARYTWMSWNDAANYLLSQNIALEDALAYADKSIAMEDRPENEFTKSKILTALGRPVEVPSDPQHAFDFEFGKWKTHVRRLSGGKWIEMDGTTTVTPLWGGRANVVSLEAEGFAGMSLRLYNPETKQWSLNYANARSGEMTTPTVGGFANGVGTFYDDETIEGRKVRVRFTVTPVSRDEVHFEQAISADGGKTWEVNWVATDTRMGG